MKDSGAELNFISLAFPSPHGEVELRRCILKNTLFVKLVVRFNSEFCTDLYNVWGNQLINLSLKMLFIVKCLFIVVIVLVHTSYIPYPDNSSLNAEMSPCQSVCRY